MYGPFPERTHILMGDGNKQSIYVPRGMCHETESCALNYEHTEEAVTSS